VIARSLRNRWPAAALVAGLLLAGGAAAAGYAAVRPPNHNFGTVPPAAYAPVQPPAHFAGHGQPSRPAGQPSRPAGQPSDSGVGAIVSLAVPVRLRIPAIGVSASIIPVGVATTGELGIPDDPRVVGWWAGGAAPGQPTGAVVLVGHIDSAASGPGALFRLAGLRPGAVVDLTAGGRTWRYTVQALRAYPKANLPTGVVFGQRVTPRLVIVSCGGPFDSTTGHYLDNIVAYAVPVPPGHS
jgi:sortase family protein